MIQYLWIVLWVVLWIVVGIVLAGTRPLAVYRISAYLRSTETSYLQIILRNLEKGITSYNLNIFMKMKEIDCHLFPVIHLLSSISCHPSPVIHPYQVAMHIMPWSISGRDPSLVNHLWPLSISGRYPSPAAIHLRQQSISSCNPSPAAIHFWLWCSSFQPFVSTVWIIALVWAAFCDCSCSSVSPLKVIFTNLHNVCLPLTLHRSPIIHSVAYRPS